MNKAVVVGMLLLLAASIAAQDLESRIVALEQEDERIKAAIDELQRKRVANDPVKLAEALQWGKGWALDLSVGAPSNSPIGTLGFASPKFMNMISVDLRAGLGAELLFTSGEPPVTDYGLLLAPRVAAWTPMLFNFMRAYAGLEGYFTATNTIASFNGAQFSLGGKALAGLEVYVSKWLALFAEAGGPVSHQYYFGASKNPSQISYTSAPFFTAGLRFYVGQ